jgi:hypothetical protein
MTVTLERWKVNGLTVQLHVDEDCASPREDDNLGTLVGWHRKYRLGDEQPRESPQEWMAAFQTEHPDWRSAVIMPVYMFEHSGVALRCHDFGDRWDSGQVGWIYCVPARIRKAYGCTRITKKVRAQVMRVLQGEVEDYGRYVNGETYAYTIEDAHGEVLDSCCGFIGWECAKEQAEDAARACTSGVTA